MTRRHFERIAETLASLKPETGNCTPPGILASATRQWQLTVDAFRDMCADTNQNFDAARFMAACEGATARTAAQKALEEHRESLPENPFSNVPFAPLQRRTRDE